jgi:hypothetical protein
MHSSDIGRKGSLKILTCLLERKVFAERSFINGKVEIYSLSRIILSPFNSVSSMAEGSRYAKPVLITISLPVNKAMNIHCVVDEVLT